MNEEEGMRVAVLSPRDKEFIGYGTIKKVEPILLEDVGLVVEDYPSLIELDNGVKTEGEDCWWVPFSEELKNTIEKAGLRPLSKEEAEKILNDEVEE